MTTLTYSTTAVNDRLQGVVTAIDSGGTNGNLRLLAGNAVVATFPLAANPCGIVANTVLTLSGNLIDVNAIGGAPTTARIENSNGDVIVSGLSVGMSSAGPHDITLSSSTIKPGDVVSLLSAQIQGAA